MGKGLKKSFNLSDNRPLSPYYLLFIICFLLFPSAVKAQETFTEHLTRNVAGEGTVVLIQDNEITALINGTITTSNVHPHQSHAVVADSTAIDSENRQNLHPTHRTQAIGYRIQVYAGGNNRKSKSEAHRMGNIVRSSFSDVPVYTSFMSPRWVCRVGDYRTREEANEQLHKMRQTHQFVEASIVKSKIFIYH